MRSFRQVITGGIALTALALVFGIIWPTCRVLRSFDRFEQNARRVITAAELQAWATNLLAQHEPGSMKVADLGTSIPQSLLKLYRHPPFIMIYGPRTNDMNLAEPGWVRLTLGRWRHWALRFRNRPH